MKTFKVRKGTIGTVYPPGKLKRLDGFAVTKDLIFDREEMIFDPVALQNNQLNGVSNWCRMMAKKGNAGFRRDKHLLVVPYNKVKMN